MPSIVKTRRTDVPTYLVWEVNLNGLDANVLGACRHLEAVKRGNFAQLGPASSNSEGAWYTS